MRNRVNKGLKGGHEHEDLPHYHLWVKLPSGKVKELHEQFERSFKERDVSAVTVGNVIQLVEDEIGTDKPFTLFWNGKKLDNPNVKLRKIVVDGKKFGCINRW